MGGKGKEGTGGEERVGKGSREQGRGNVSPSPAPPPVSKS